MKISLDDQQYLTRHIDQANDGESDLDLTDDELNSTDLSDESFSD